MSDSELNLNDLQQAYVAAVLVPSLLNREFLGRSFAHRAHPRPEALPSGLDAGDAASGELARVSDDDEALRVWHGV